MGLLVDGVWQDRWYDTEKKKGRFERPESLYRHWITPDGSPGPSGQGGFAAESGRYHLYVSLACPWAHRALIFRKLKGLESMISISVVSPDMMEQGWSFSEYPAATQDALFGSRYLHQVYTRAQSDFTGRVTVPLLWDKEQQTIVNNESSEIIRMFNSAFDHLGAHRGDYYPEPLRPAIDEINDMVYHQVNNGVYKTGFATTQEAYEEAFHALFDALDQLEDRLSKHRYLVGNHLSEADWRLFTTLVRFDPVYVGHFKCNKRRIVDYPNIFNYLKELYQMSGVAETVNMDHIKRHYYYSHANINPTRIVPVGPELDLTGSHDRDRLH